VIEGSRRLTRSIPGRFYSPHAQPRGLQWSGRFNILGLLPRTLAQRSVTLVVRVRFIFAISAI